MVKNLLQKPVPPVWIFGVLFIGIMTIGIWEPLSSGPLTSNQWEEIGTSTLVLAAILLVPFLLGQSFAHYRTARVIASGGVGLAYAYAVYKTYQVANCTSWFCELDILLGWFAIALGGVVWLIFITHNRPIPLGRSLLLILATLVGIIVTITSLEGWLILFGDQPMFF